MAKTKVNYEEERRKAEEAQRKADRLRREQGRNTADYSTKVTKVDTTQKKVPTANTSGGATSSVTKTVNKSEPTENKPLPRLRQRESKEVRQARGKEFFNPTTKFEGTTDEEFVNQALKADKLNRVDAKRAKQITKDYFKNNNINPSDTEVFENPQLAEQKKLDAFNRMTPAEKEKYNKMQSLENKTSNAYAFTRGMGSAIPFLDRYINKKEQENNVADELRSSTQKESTTKQNPLANFGGQAVGNAITYDFANGILGGVGAYDKAGKALSNIPGVGKVGEEVFADILRGQSADALLDTLPMVVDDIKDGKSAKDTTLDALKNQAVNLGFNVLPNLSGIVGNLKGSNVVDAISDVPRIDDAWASDVPLNRVDDWSKNIDVAKGVSDDVMGEMVNTPNDVLKSNGTPQTKLSTLNDEGISQHYSTLGKSTQFDSPEMQAILEGAKDSGAFDKSVEGVKQTLNNNQLQGLLTKEEIDEILNTKPQVDVPINDYSDIDWFDERNMKASASKSIDNHKRSISNSFSKYVKSDEDKALTASFRNAMDEFKNNPSFETYENAYRNYMKVRDSFAGRSYLNKKTNVTEQFNDIADSLNEIMQENLLGDIAYNIQGQKGDLNTFKQLVDAEDNLKAMENWERDLSDKGETYKLLAKNKDLTDSGNPETLDKLIKKYENMAAKKVNEYTKAGNTRMAKTWENRMKKYSTEIPEALDLYKTRPTADDIFSERKRVADMRKSYNDSLRPKTDTSNKEQANDIANKLYNRIKDSDMFKSATSEASNTKVKGVSVENRKATMDAAAKEFAENPDKVRQQVLYGNWTEGGKDIDKSALVLNDAIKNGADPTEINMILRNQSARLTNAGRELRAVQDNYIGTKEGTLMQGAKYLNEKADKVLKNTKSKEAKQINSIAESCVNGNFAQLTAKLKMDDKAILSIKNAVASGAKADDVARMIATYKEVGVTEISKDTLAKVNDIYERIENFGVNSKQRADLEAQAYAVLAKEIGGKKSFKDMWNSWRYLAMLGNPKTHFRNLLGNTTHYMVTEAKDNLASVMEGFADATNKTFGGQGIDRTKAMLNRLSSKDNNLIKMARDDAKSEAYKMLNDGNKYRDTKNAIKDNMRAFNNNKVLNAVEGFNSNALDAEDYLGLKIKYSKSLARYLKANGADASIFTKNDDASRALLDRAREHAVKEAKEATFHADNAIADALNQFSSNLNNSEKLSMRIGGAMMEGLLPFKKTPANILQQGLKYSPLSLAKSIGDMASAVTTGKKNASDAIESLASGLTGTGILALGAYLADKGILSGKGDSDYDISVAQNEQGKQDYALQFGGKSYTLDWLAPASMPLFVGAELYKDFTNKNDDTDAFSKFMGALSAIAEPITEMSMLQGINDVLEQISQGKENALATLATNTATGYVTQGVPTIGGQIARAIDPIRRDTYSEQPTGLKKQLDRALTKTENKIPGLSQTNPEYFNTKGQTQQNVPGLENSLAGRLAYQMFSPGYFATDANVTDTDRELNRLYEATGEKVYGTITNGKVGDVKLSKKDKARYQELYGQTNTLFADSIVASDKYNNLDDDTKAKVIKDARSLAKAIADYEIGGKEITSTQQKAYEAYQNGGVQGVADFLLDKEVSSIANNEAQAQGFNNAQEMQTASSVLGSEQNAVNYASFNNSVNSKYADGDKKKASDGEFIAELKSQNLSDEEKGNYLITRKGGVDKLSDEAKKAYSSDGANGVWKLYDGKYSSTGEKVTKKNSQAEGLPSLSENVTKYYSDKGDLKGLSRYDELNKAYKAYSWTATSKPQNMSSAGARKLIPFLKQQGVNPVESGDIIIAAGGGIDKLSEGARGAYDMQGSKGVYNYYNIKTGADYDGNGNVKKEDELIPFLAYDNTMTPEEKNAYVQILFPKNKVRYF